MFLLSFLTSSYRKILSCFKVVLIWALVSFSSLNTILSFNTIFLFWLVKREFPSLNFDLRYLYGDSDCELYLENLTVNFTWRFWLWKVKWKIWLSNLHGDFRLSKKVQKIRNFPNFQSFPVVERQNVVMPQPKYFL